MSQDSWIDPAEHGAPSTLDIEVFRRTVRRARRDQRRVRVAAISALGLCVLAVSGWFVRMEYMETEPRSKMATAVSPTAPPKPRTKRVPRAFESIAPRAPSFDDILRDGEVELPVGVRRGFVIHQEDQLRVLQGSEGLELNVKSDRITFLAHRPGHHRITLRRTRRHLIAVDGTYELGNPQTEVISLHVHIVTRHE